MFAFPVPFHGFITIEGFSYLQLEWNPYNMTVTAVETMFSLCESRGDANEQTEDERKEEQNDHILSCRTSVLCSMTSRN
jgi:hypothetical protein